jgi:hypothetical protein
VPAETNLSGAATLLDDGSILLGGYQRTGTAPTNTLDPRHAALARLDADGRFDPSFGTRGIVTIDLPGDLDRIAAIDVLPDGRLVAGAWSRMEYNPYDCDEDRVALLRFESDGSRPETLYAAVRSGFVSCRNTLTLQVVGGNPGGQTELYFGSEVGIVAFGGSGEPAGPVTRENWRYGTFLVGPALMALLLAVATGRRPSIRRPLSLVHSPLCLTPPARSPSHRRSLPPPRHPPAPATRTRAPA